MFYKLYLISVQTKCLKQKKTSLTSPVKTKTSASPASTSNSATDVRPAPIGIPVNLLPYRGQTPLQDHLQATYNPTTSVPHGMVTIQIPAHVLAKMKEQADGDMTKRKAYTHNFSNIRCQMRCSTSQIGIQVPSAIQLPNLVGMLSKPILCLNQQTGMAQLSQNASSSANGQGSQKFVLKPYGGIRPAKSSTTVGSDALSSCNQSKPAVMVYGPFENSGPQTDVNNNIVGKGCHINERETSSKSGKSGKKKRKKSHVASDHDINQNVDLDIVHLTETDALDMGDGGDITHFRNVISENALSPEYLDVDESNGMATISDEEDMLDKSK